MPDTTVKKVTAASAPKGKLGQKYLTSGTHVAMRLWEQEPANEKSAASERDYETVGYVISGRAELNLDGQTILLEPGDCWLVPQGARHSYAILDRFTAVEATSPPARVHARDEKATGLGWGLEYDWRAAPRLRLSTRQLVFVRDHADLRIDLFHIRIRFRWHSLQATDFCVAARTYHVGDRGGFVAYIDVLGKLFYSK
jgi:quercetin dioxygenase-like cupin family protein